MLLAMIRYQRLISYNILCLMFLLQFFNFSIAVYVGCGVVLVASLLSIFALLASWYGVGACVHVCVAGVGACVCVCGGGWEHVCVRVAGCGSMCVRVHV